MILGILREAELFSGFWGAKGKILIGSSGNCFQGFGEINALFSGIKGAQTPWRPQRCDFTGGGGLDPCMLKTLRRG